jgi:hypothetical protein
MDTIELITELPRELQFVVFSFTDEFARRYARKLKFKKFGSENNSIFPRNFFTIAPKIVYPPDADKLWNVERKLGFIIKEKREYIKSRIKRPCLQYSVNNNHDFKEDVFPESHNIKYSLWAVNDYRKLISYSLKVALDGYYTILVIKSSHFNKFDEMVEERIVNHKMGGYISEYFVYCDPSFKKRKCNGERGVVIPKIFCIPYDYDKIRNIKGFIDLLRLNNKKSYLLTPYTNNSKTNLLVKYLSLITNGSGKYELGE